MVAVVGVGSALLGRPTGRWSLLAVPAVVALSPLAFQWAPWVAGPEGVLEALTAGLLLGLVVRGRSSPWLAVAAGVLLLEELNYGQVLLGFPTPSFLGELPATDGQLNFHDNALGGLWRLVPLLVMLGVSRRPALADRFNLPRFNEWTWTGITAVLVLTPLVSLLASGQVSNEGFELAVVCLATLAWTPRADPAPATKEAEKA